MSETHKTDSPGIIETQSDIADEKEKKQVNEIEEDEESLEYVETEPVLAYTRMKNDINEILIKDSVSCIRSDHKILVLGTHWGRIHIMDHEGNKIMTKDQHESTVNDVTIDLKEEYVASCGDDGKVTIFGLCESSHDQVIEFNRPIKSVELEPNFSHTFSFVTGDTKLVLNEKGFMNRRKTIVLNEGEGIIRNIKWINDLIAWSNDKGVKIYCLSEKRIITYIVKDHDARYRDELYRCSLLWTDANTLIIGWADRFKICKVVRKNSMSGISSQAHVSRIQTNNPISALAASVLSNNAGLNVALMTANDRRDIPTHVEITCMVQTDFFICGLAPFSQKNQKDNQFLILCYEKPEKENDNSPLGIPEDARPHIRVIEVHSDSFEETSLDAFQIKDFEKNRPCDYRLDFIRDEGLYFVLGPKDVIKASPRSFDDHIRWLMERFNFEQALDDIKTAPANIIKFYTYDKVAMNYIDYLLITKEYKEAAEWCSKVTLDNRNWEEKILIFAKEGKLEEIFEKIPSANPTLTPAIYEKVLNEFLRLKNYQVFKYLIKKWPCNIYDLKCITNAVLDAQRKDNNRIILEALAVLYEYQKLFDKSLVIYINLSDQTVFDFLFKHNLYDCAFENIISLIALDRKKAISILVDNVEKIPVKRVVEQLSKNKLYLHYYLDAIFEKDPNLSKDFHTMQVVLYAEFEREKLLKFLQNSQYIILAQAQKELQERNLVPEIVYILERMGQIKKALQLILHAIKDVNQAIEFCKKHNDKELWDELIKFSLNKPEYIIGLLNNIGTHVDPVDLINKIPNGVKIKGLRDALVKVLQDYKVQLSLLEGSKKIMSGDCLNLMNKQIRIVKKGICIEENQKCLICEGFLTSSNITTLKRLRVFECKHIFHDDCIQLSGSCTVCSQSKQTSFVLNADI